jgi:NhaC family Na+:H+ antiporter
MMPETRLEQPSPSLLDALIPTLTLIGLLSTSVFLFGEDSSYGANQIALIITAFIAITIGMKNGIRWHEFEAALYQGINLAMGAILILLAVGSLIGSWILSGTVPAMIYYGLKLMDPSWFYASSCLVSGLVALSIGSSWTVAGTIGIGFMGVAGGLGLSLEITAGAIISGAYFGDKLSPLSDTTNLAPASVGVGLFEHIRHLLWTTVPSITIALIAFIFIGFNIETSNDNQQIGIIMKQLETHFTISPILLAPIFIVVILAWKKVPAFPSIIIGAITGSFLALIFQQDVIIAFVGDNTLLPILALAKGVWIALFDGFTANTGNSVLDDLLTRGGMSSMLNTVWLIISAMVFGAAMEKAGFLNRLIQGALELAQSSTSLIIITLFTCIGANIVTADQYISIILPGRMYKLEYARRGLAPINLSRALEDSGTVTSPLIPWNTCGAYMAGTLGVATFAYLPYCIFNLVTPMIAIIYALLNFQIIPLKNADGSNSTIQSFA